MQNQLTSSNHAGTAWRRKLWCLGAAGATLATYGLVPALGSVHTTKDDRTGILHLQSDATWIDKSTSATAACEMTPAGSKRYKVPFVRVLFESPTPRPEWYNVSPNAKAAIFTPYKRLKVRLNHIHLGNREGLEVQMKPDDFVHMARCQKARLVYKNVGITLHANNLAEIKTVANHLQEVG